MAFYPYFQYFLKIYRTIILPFILYGCETWSVTLMEEHRLRNFEKSLLREIFGPKRGGGDLYSSPNIIRVIK